MILDEVYQELVMPEAAKSQAKDLLNRIFWDWFHANYNRKLTTIRIWFISKTIYVKDLRDIFTLLFGPENGLSTGSSA